MAPSSVPFPHVEKRKLNEYTMAVIYHNGEESIKKYKGKVLVCFVGGQFWKAITREVDF